MRVYVKIGMLFLAFTCIFALVACKGTDEKKGNRSNNGK